MRFLIASLLLFLGSINSSFGAASRVLELSDRFLEVRHEGQWLVMFYAPWCAYCRRTEPVFSLVSQALHNTNIRVARLDCSRFPAAASKFKVNGYPTIIFIKNNQEYVYHGDRTKEELIDFVLRMSGPPVQLVTRTESIEMLKGAHKIFFMYVGEQNGLVWSTFNTAAENYQEHGFFYATSVELASQHFPIDFISNSNTNENEDNNDDNKLEDNNNSSGDDKTIKIMQKKSQKQEQVSTLIVYKDENHYYYPHSSYAHKMNPVVLNDTIHHWINVERFTMFPKITRFNIHQLLKTKKWIVIAVVEENKLNEIATHELEFRDMIEDIIRKYHDKYHDKFQFGWIGDPDIAHSIVMDTLPTPHLIVLNSTTQHHHIPEDDPLQLTPQAIHMFLESIYNESAPIYGGNSFLVRFYRAYFEAKRSLIEMWRGNPVLTTVLFGLPLGFLSLILYSIFCGDCLDAPEDDEEDHEKKE